MKYILVAMLLLFSAGEAEAAKKRRHCAISAVLSAGLESMGVPYKITSTCGGKHAKRSYHYRRDHAGRTMAVDFRVAKRHAKRAYRVLRSFGLCAKHYGGGLFHVDTGPMRHW